MRESAYQAKLKIRISEMFPGCVIRKGDANEKQGAPDLLILFGNKWAMLEVKASATAPTRPNQPYYVELYNEMSFCAFIFPENEEEVLRGLQVAFGTRK